VKEGSWTVFHITKTSDSETQVAITKADPTRLTDHFMHKATNVVN
jgi:hypothetical protein